MSPFDATHVQALQLHNDVLRQLSGDLEEQVAILREVAMHLTETANRWAPVAEQRAQARGHVPGASVVAHAARRRFEEERLV
jgi:hypothetical protein